MPRKASPLGRLRNARSEGLTVDPAQFFAASRLVIVAGKGGVGKTTVSAALARAAALSGLSTLIVEVEGKSGLAALFGREPLDLRRDRARARGRPRGGDRHPGPDADRRTTRCSSTCSDHGMSRISRAARARPARSTSSPPPRPGSRTSSILGKVKQLERAEDRGPAHPRRARRRPRDHVSPVGPGAARRGPGRPDQQPGPRRARDAHRSQRCQVVLVTLARGDAGERAGRHRLPPRGPGRRRASGPSSSTACTTRSAGSTPNPKSRPQRRGHGPAQRRGGGAGGGRRLPAPPHGSCSASRSAGSPRSSRCRSCACPILFNADLGRDELEVLAHGRCSPSIGALQGSGFVNELGTAARVARPRSSSPRVRAGSGRRRPPRCSRSKVRTPGRRAVVVTIDPAKRLADALGLEGLSNTPSQIDGDRGRASCGR